MTTLVACISSGAGTVAHVGKVISDENWEKVILIATNETKDFKSPKPAEIIVINPSKTLPEITEDIKNALKGKVDFEVGVNFISGSGKEHMALISALMKLGAGIRLVALTKEGIKEI